MLMKDVIIIIVQMSFKSHSMAECDSSNHLISIIVAFVIIIFFDFFSQTDAQIYFKNFVDVPWLDLYQVR